MTTMKRADLRADTGWIDHFDEVTDDDLRTMAPELLPVLLTDNDRLLSKALCDALEVFLRERGVYPTKGYRVAPGDKTIGPEDVLEVLLAAVKEEA